MTVKLSVCIICKNEQKNIERCLKSVAWADEVVILDSGSSDDTLAIARRYTDKIYCRDDWEGFGVQRQRAQALASNDWILAVDCDEEVSSQLAQEIAGALSEADEHTVFMLNRLTNFCGQFIYHSGWHPDFVHRIYNKKHYGYNSKTVHEAVSCGGARKVKLRHTLAHYQFDDLYLYTNKRNSYAETGATEKLSMGKKSSLSKAVTSSLFAFIRHYFLKRGFLDGKIGFIIAVIQMQYTFNKYVFLLNKQASKSKGKIEKH